MLAADQLAIAHALSGIIHRNDAAVFCAQLIQRQAEFGRCHFHQHKPGFSGGRAHSHAAFPNAGRAGGAAHIDGDMRIALHNGDAFQRQIELFGDHLRPAHIRALAHIDFADPACGAAVFINADIGGEIVGLHRQARGHGGGFGRNARQRNGNGQCARSCQESATARGSVHHVLPVLFSWEPVSHESRVCAI